MSKKNRLIFKRAAAAVTAFLMTAGQTFALTVNAEEDEFLADSLTEFVRESIVKGDTSGVEINEVNFPDDVFRAYVLENFDTNEDGVLSNEEISAVKYIHVSGTYEVNNNIKSLKGVEYFTALTTLYCTYNQLTSLDVSKNTALTTLYCFNNQLTSLDVSNNTALTSLRCGNNQLTSLDIGDNSAIIDLICDNNEYYIGETCGVYDLKNLPAGFDISNASVDADWQGATLTDSKLTEINGTGYITYYYYCGSLHFERFRLAYDLVEHSYVDGVCSECGATECVHSLLSRPYREPTCSDTGQVSHWWCNICGKYFSDESAKNEITYQEYEIPALGHDYKDGICERCGKHDLTVKGTVSGKCGDNVTWTLDASGLLTISGTGAMFDYGYRDEAPWHEYIVAQEVSSVNVTEGVTRIGIDAFSSFWGRSSIESVVIPQSVTEIGQFAFSGCRFKTIELPESLTTIEQCAFDSCEMDEIVIPRKVAHLEEGLFQFGEIKSATILNPTLEFEMLSSSCTVFGGDRGYADGVTKHIEPIIHGYKNSTAQGYAEKWGAEFVEIPCTHTLTAVSAKAATCTAEGNKAYWHCETCNNYFSDSTGTTETTLAAVTIAATGHSYSNGSCSVCGAVDPSYTTPTPDPEPEPEPEPEPDPEHTHDMTATAEKAPSCTEDGNRAYWYCPDCDMLFLDKDGETETTLEEVIIPALGHIFEDGICTVCGENDPDYVKPENPTVTGVIAGDGQVTLNWGAVEGAKWYRIYYKVSGTKLWVSPARVDAKTTSYTVKGLVNGIKYEFVVKAAINGAWTTSTAMDIVSATPLAAVNPTITSLTARDRQVTVNWGEVTEATRYRVYWKQSGGIWQAKNLSASATSYTVTGLVNNINSAFLVRAEVNGKFTSYTANDIKIAVPRAAQTANPKITKVTTAEGKVNIQWNAVSGATRYRVYWKHSGGIWQAVNVSSSTTSYTLKNLDRNKGYAFLVRAEVNGKFTAYTANDMVTAVPRAVKNSELETDAMEFPETEIPVFEFTGMTLT